MKNQKNIIILFVFLMGFSSCQNHEIPDRYKIYGYAIGDTITDDFEIIDIRDFPWSVAVYKKDNRFETWLINNHFSSFLIKNISGSEEIFTVEHISKVLKTKPEHYKDSTKAGLPIKEGQVYYWNDAFSNDAITYLTQLHNDSIMISIRVINSVVSDSLFVLSGSEHEPEFSGFD